MASGQTANYGLNQWAAEDRVLREEFNQDNAKIDEEMLLLKRKLPQFHLGTYIGTGLFGINDPNVLEFPFVPQMVVIQENSGGSGTNGAILIYGQEICSGIVSSHGLGLRVTWMEKRLSWYTTQSYPEYQLNFKDRQYYYLAIG